MDYIEESFGLPVKPISAISPDTLPLYLTDRYQMTAATIGEIPVVFVTPKTSLEQTQALKKHLSRIEKSACSHAVLILKSVSYYRRKSLITAHIPFVIPNKQLYLPFLGVLLQQQSDAEYTSPEFLQPSAQALLLYFIYRHTDWLYISEAVQHLGYSAMTISRAVRQLVDLGLFTEYKEGVQKIICTKHSGEDLFDLALPHLSTPVKQELYVPTDTLPQSKLLAGISALAEHSMLNPEAPICYGVYYKTKITGTSQLVDSSLQNRIQLWKYDPELFRQWTFQNTVDPLSLFLSLKDHPDERIEEALDGYIKNYWKDY